TLSPVVIVTVSVVPSKAVEASGVRRSSRASRCNLARKRGAGRLPKGRAGQRPCRDNGAPLPHGFVCRVRKGRESQLSSRFSMLQTSRHKERTGDDRRLSLGFSFAKPPWHRPTVLLPVNKQTGRFVS